MCIHFKTLWLNKTFNNKYRLTIWKKEFEVPELRETKEPGPNPRNHLFLRNAFFARKPIFITLDFTLF